MDGKRNMSKSEYKRLCVQDPNRMACLLMEYEKDAKRYRYWRERGIAIPSVHPIILTIGIELDEYTDSFSLNSIDL